MKLQASLLAPSGHPWLQTIIVFEHCQLLACNTCTMWHDVQLPAKCPPHKWSTHQYILKTLVPQRLWLVSSSMPGVLVPINGPVAAGLAHIVCIVDVVHIAYAVHIVFKVYNVLTVLNLHIVYLINIVSSVWISYSVHIIHIANTL